MMPYSISIRRFLKAISPGAIALFLVLGLWSISAIAQPTSAVVLDGRPLFQVSALAPLTAQERANAINLQLQEAIKAGEPVEAKVEERNGTPSIMLNDRYLMTVTAQDTVGGNTPKQQANQWLQELKNALKQAESERSGAYLQQTVLVALAIGLLAAILHHWLGWLARRCSQLAEQRLPPDEADSTNLGTAKLLQLVLKIILAIARIGLWLIATLYIANLFPFTRRWSYQISSLLVSSFTSPLLTLGNKSYTVVDLSLLAAMLVAWIILARTFSNLLRSRLLSATGIELGAQEAIAALTRYALIVLGTVVLLQVWGLDISSLTIVASALGLGIGLGLQNIAKNFSSGLVLIFERPIQVGDFVEVGELKGVVERIGGRSTEIRTLDRVSIIVPNSQFLETQVINWSHRNPASRLHLPVGVAYGSDPEAVRAALLEAAESHPRVLKTPPPQVLFVDFGDSALKFDLLVWTTKPSQQFLLKSDLRFAIYKILAERKIEIPFPQRDLNLSPQVESALTLLSEKIKPSNGQVLDAIDRTERDLKSEK